MATKDCLRAWTALCMKENRCWRLIYHSTKSFLEIVSLRRRCFNCFQQASEGDNEGFVNIRSFPKTVWAV